MLFSRNKEQKKVQVLVRMETVTAKQIKNTFADVKEIEFSEGYTENSLAGITAVDVTISTTYGVVSDIGVSMFLNNKAETLESYAGGTEFKEGVTVNEVNVIFSDKTKRSL